MRTRVVGCEVEFVGGFDFEGGVPSVDVADGFGAIHARGVRVGEDLLAEGVVADLGAPVLGVGDEELLVAGEVVDDGCGLAFERGVVRVEGGGDSGYVGDVFGEGLAAVDGDVGEGVIGVVLGGEGVGRCFEVSEVFGGPPVADAAAVVEGGSFGVEGVGDLVADDGSDGSVVGGVGSLGIEEGRLEDGGGEVERVVEREVDGVYGLRLHGPFLAIDGGADAVDLVVVLEEVAAPDVAEEVVGLHFIA